MVILFINGLCIFWMWIQEESISKQYKIESEVWNWQFGFGMKLFFGIVV